MSTSLFESEARSRAGTPLSICVAMVVLSASRSARLPCVAARATPVGVLDGVGWLLVLRPLDAWASQYLRLPLRICSKGALHLAHRAVAMGPPLSCLGLYTPCGKRPKRRGPMWERNGRVFEGGCAHPLLRICPQDRETGSRRGSWGSPEGSDLLVQQRWPTSEVWGGCSREGVRCYT